MAAETEDYYSLYEEKTVKGSGYIETVNLSVDGFTTEDNQIGYYISVERERGYNQEQSKTSITVLMVEALEAAGGVCLFFGFFCSDNRTTENSSVSLDFSGLLSKNGFCIICSHTEERNQPHPENCSRAANQNCAFGT